MNIMIKKNTKLKSVQINFTKMSFVNLNEAQVTVSGNENNQNSGMSDEIFSQLTNEMLVSIDAFFEENPQRRIPIEPVVDFSQVADYDDLLFDDFDFHPMITRLPARGYRTIDCNDPALVRDILEGRGRLCSLCTSGSGFSRWWLYRRDDQVVTFWHYVESYFNDSWSPSQFIQVTSMDIRSQLLGEVFPLGTDNPEIPAPIVVTLEMVNERRRSRGQPQLGDIPMHLEEQPKPDDEETPESRHHI